MTDASPPAPRIRKAWRVTVRGYDGFGETVYAATAGKARMAIYYRLADVRVQRIVDIIVHRQAYRDVVLPGLDPRAKLMSAEERECLLHAFGNNQHDPATAGRRDYFYTERDDPRLVALAGLGLMIPMDGEFYGEGYTYFVLTPAGRHVALSLVPEYAR